jgi:hypothetical protein
MKTLLTILAVIVVLTGVFYIGGLAGQDVERQTVAKKHLGQYYLDSKTGKVDFQYLDLQAYTQSIFEAITPQKAPVPGQ